MFDIDYRSAVTDLIVEHLLHQQQNMHAGDLEVSGRVPADR